MCSLRVTVNILWGPATSKKATIRLEGSKDSTYNFWPFIRKWKPTYHFVSHKGKKKLAVEVCFVAQCQDWCRVFSILNSAYYKYRVACISANKLLFFKTSNRLNNLLIIKFSPENVKSVGGGHLPKVRYKKCPF